MKKYLELFSLFIVVFLSCTRSDMVAANGSGSTTTNGFVATIYRDDGTVLPYAPVSIRPVGYLADSASWEDTLYFHQYIDTVTDSIGVVRVDSMVPGVYSISVLDGLGHAVLFRGEVRADTIIDYGRHVLQQVGIIRGRIDPVLFRKSAAKPYAQIYGTDRMAPVDSSGLFTLDSVPPQMYSIRVSVDDNSFKPLEYTAVEVFPGKTTDILPYTGWAHKAMVTLDTTISQLLLDEDVDCFPLLVRLNSSNFSFTTAKKKGEDVRICTGDDVPLPFEIERWDSATGAAAIWVYLDTVFCNRPNQQLMIHWGNATAKTGSIPEAVFDTGRGFCGVWHMGQSGGDTAEDATTNQYIGVPRGMDGADDVAGVIGYAQQFDGTLKSISVVQGGSRALDVQQGSTYSVSAWVYAEGDAGVILSNGPTQYELLVNNQQQWTFSGAGDGYGMDTVVASVTTRGWTHLVGVRYGNRLLLYVNGNLADSSNGVMSSRAIASDSGGFAVGRDPNSESRWFRGIVDEVCVTNKHSSPSRVRLSYENQRIDSKLVQVREVE